MTAGELSKLIGANVRAARERRGKTQQQLADATDIAKPHVSRLEAGTHLPSLKTILRVANALEVSICSLVEQKPAAKSGAKRGKK